MSEGLLVVEAGSHSGSLITARCALEQGRDVYAVPGSVLSTDFAGTNDLINDGAYVVTQPVQLLSGYAERYHLDLDRVPSVQQLLAAEQDPGANLPQTSKEYDFERLEEGRQRLMSYPKQVQDWLIPNVWGEAPTVSENRGGQ